MNLRSLRGHANQTSSTSCIDARKKCGEHYLRETVLCIDRATLSASDAGTINLDAISTPQIVAFTRQLIRVNVSLTPGAMLSTESSSTFSTLSAKKDRARHYRIEGDTR